MKFFKLLLVLTLFVSVGVISGCSDEPVFDDGDSSGSNGSNGGSNGSTSTPTSLSVSMTLKDGPATSDNNISSISPGNPGYLTIFVVDQNGDAAANQIATVNTSLALVSPTTFLTDSSGRAQTTLEYNENIGADKVDVSVDLEGTIFLATKNYAVSTTNTTILSSISISLSLKDGPASTDTDVSVISADSPGFLTMTIVDETGSAVENQIATVSTKLANVVPTTVLTDASGIAQSRLDYTNSLGADEIVVTALFDGTTYSASQNYAVIAPSIQMGDASGASFVSGQLELGTENLSAGGSASVSAYLVDANNQPFTTPLEVDFSTVCASLTTPLASIDRQVTTSSGIASATYQASGCTGEDTITATVTFGGSEFTATGAINVATDQAGSINFVSATPAQITLQGGATVAGLQETSIVRFQVVDTSGSPIKNQNVTFSVNGSAGGLTFTPGTGVTNADGEVFTVVQAGSIPLVVNIIATVDTTEISTQSTGLVISAGLPDDDSFTLGADLLNPEALNFNGKEVEVTAHLADIYNNPPPTGTPVFFTTEGGSIGATCNTDESGRCTVLWLSGEPPPADNRATILAYTQGVESFTDINSNGRFSNGDAITRDLTEVFRDDNENNSFDTGEFFVDFNESGAIDVISDGQYNGNLCDADAGIAGGCSSQTSLNISREIVITFSASKPALSIASGGVVLARSGKDINGNFLIENQLNDLNIVDSQATITVTYSDMNGQPLPSSLPGKGTTFVDTEILVSTETSKLGGTTRITQTNTSVAGSNSFDFTLEDFRKNADPAAPDPLFTDSGRVTIRVRTPEDIVTEVYFTVNE